MSYLKEFEEKARAYKGVKTEWVDGGLISHKGDRRTDLEVKVPCTDGTEWGFTLQEETAAGLFMTMKAVNTEAQVNEEIINQIAACYNKTVVFEKES
jgi:hypothetical protein